MRPASCPCSAATVQCSIRIASPPARTMGPGHDVAGAEDVGVADGRQRRVAFEPRVQLQAAVRQPLGVRERAHPDDDEVGWDARAVGQLDGLDPVGAMKRGDAGAEAQIDAALAVQLGAPFPEFGTERQHRRRRDVDQGDVEVLLASGLGDLAPDEARTHDRDPRTPRERGAQRDPVIEAAQDVDTLQVAAGTGPAFERATRSPGSAGHTAPRHRRRARPPGARDPGRSPRRPGATARRACRTGGGPARARARRPAPPSTVAAACTAGGARRPPSPARRSNPSARAACAARSPASDAPTMTTRSTWSLRSVLIN